MPRFSAEQFAAAAAAGTPRPSASFTCEDDWHSYQESWLSIFSPSEVLPPVGDKDRRLRWKAAMRQYGKIETARAKREADEVTMIPASFVAGEAVMIPQPASIASTATTGQTRDQSVDVSTGNRLTMSARLQVSEMVLRHISCLGRLDTKSGVCNGSNVIVMSCNFVVCTVACDSTGM